MEKLPGHMSITVAGLGYVGLPLFVLIAQAGYQVTGYDINEAKIISIESGQFSTGDIDSEDLAQLLIRDDVKLTTNPQCIKDSDIIIVCVPTLMNQEKLPDLTPLNCITETIAHYLQLNQLVVYESSTYPGCTRNLLSILQQSGLMGGRDFSLSFSPERIDPGNKKYQIYAIPKIVGGLTASCTERVRAFYATIFKEVLAVSSLETAEFVKLFENTFRFINIAYANEMAVAAESLGLNIWEVIRAATTKPFGYQPFYPGPGVGGSCIPINPWYLQYALFSQKANSQLIDTADNINLTMSQRIVDKTLALLKNANVHRKGRILCLGVAYKRDVSDWRLSPVIPILESLKKLELNIRLIDPFVQELTIGKEKMTVFNEENLFNLLQWADVVILITDHTKWNYETIRQFGKQIIDTRGVYEKVNNENIWTLGKGCI